MEFLTDEQVEMEISVLSASEEVRLARLDQRIKYRKRQRLYNLRALAKRGAKLKEQGYTFESMKEEEKELEE
jgi:hypothetical protein